MLFIIFNDNIYIEIYQIRGCFYLNQDFRSFLCIILYLFLVPVLNGEFDILMSRNEPVKVRRLVELNKQWVLLAENNLPSSIDGYEVLGEVLIVSRKVKK